MGLFREKIKGFKRTDTLYFKLNPTFMLGLTNEVLCILVPQRAAKLPKVIVGYLRKNPGLEPEPQLIRTSGRIFL